MQKTCSDLTTSAVSTYKTRLPCTFFTELDSVIANCHCGQSLGLNIGLLHVSSSDRLAYA